MRAVLRRALTSFIIIGGLGCASVPTPSSIERSGYDHQTRSREDVIVFVHGIWGERSGTWKNPQNGADWRALIADDTSNVAVNDILPIRLAQMGVYSVSYLSPKSGAAMGVPALAARILQELKDKGVFQYRRIHFVAHSMGGIIVKGMILSMQAGSDRDLTRIRSVNLIASPARGSQLADYARGLGLSTAQIDAVVSISNNPFLQNQDIDWQKFFKYGRVAGLPLISCAYETQPTKFGFFVVTSEQAVTSCDNVPYGMDRKDHSQVVKPADRLDDPYVWLERRIVEAIARDSVVKPPTIDGTSPFPPVLRNGWNEIALAAERTLPRDTGCAQCLGILTRSASLNLVLPSIPIDKFQVRAVQLGLTIRSDISKPGHPCMWGRIAGALVLEQDTLRLDRPTASLVTPSSTTSYDVSLDKAIPFLVGDDGTTRLLRITTSDCGRGSEPVIQNARLVLLLAQSTGSPPPPPPRPDTSWFVRALNAIIEPDGASAQLFVTAGTLREQYILDFPWFILTSDYKATGRAESSLGFVHIAGFTGAFGGVTGRGNIGIMPLYVRFGMLVGPEHADVRTASSDPRIVNDYTSVSQMGIGGMMSVSAGIPAGDNTQLRLGASMMGTSGRAGLDAFALHIGLNITGITSNKYVRAYKKLPK